MPASARRRTFLKATAASGIASLTAGCVSDVFGGSGGDSGAIKIGNVNPLTGAASTTGVPASHGAKLAEKHLNEDGGVLGRDVEVITKDSEVKPEVGVNRARELIENDSVHAITGCTSSGVGLAVSDYTAGVDTVLVTGGVQTPDLTGSKCKKTTFRAGSSTVQLNRGAAKGLSEIVDGTRVAICSPNSTFGKASAGAFKNAIKEYLDGAEIVKELYPAFGKGEYQTEIQETLNAEPDVFMTSIYPGSFISFIKQAKQYDFFQKIPYSYTGVGSTANVTPALGTDMVEMYSVERYVFNYPDSDRNERFRSDYESEWGDPPSGVPQLDYSAVTAIAKAMEQADSTDTDDIVGELEGMSYDAPEGTKQIRAADHENIDEKIWFGKLTEVDWWDSYGLGELHTVPADSVTPSPSDCSL